MNRQDHLDKYFLNLELKKEYPDLFYVRNSILEFIDSATPKMHGKILDVGCGIMPYRERIMVANNLVTSYIGLDFESSLDSEYAMGKPDLFWKGDVIPMEDNSVDTVIATEFFEHCPEPESIMKEIYRVLKPNGILIFTVPFIWNLHLIPYDEYRYTPFSLNRHLSNAEFKEIKLQALGGLDASLAQMLAIWFAQRPMRKSFKNIIAVFLIPIVKYLIAKDKAFDKYNFAFNGNMITGIGGVCYK